MRGRGVDGMHGRGVGHAWQGVCMAGGVHGRGCAWQGACVAGGGACMAGDVHGRGACMAGGVHGRDRHAWQGGVCDMHACPPTRYYEIWSMSGRYASYWNAFLLFSVFNTIGLC